MTPDRMSHEQPALWASGAFTLRIAGPGSGSGSVADVVVDRPFAVLGRVAGLAGHALTIDDPAVSLRHAYFHLDARGLFVVDLASRTGTRIGPRGELSGWLRPGHWLEVAGRRIEVRALELVGEPPRDGDPGNPLDDAGDAPLPRLTLFPEDGSREPLLLNSEFVFVGRSASCGVTVASASAMKVHCLLVRGPRGVYAVDLVGRGVWRNDLPVKGASPLLDGDSLMIGSSRFQCRIDAPGAFRAGPPALSLGMGTSAPPAPPPAVVDAGGAILEGFASPPPLHLVPAEAQAAVLGWMMGQLQARQDESSRRQAEFQTELVRLVAEIHRDNHAVLNRHLERADAIHREISELRDQIRRRFGDDAAAHIPALAAPKLPPLKITPIPPPDDPEAAANWLITRVNQLDQENRKGWKDLLGRLAGRKEE